MEHYVLIRIRDDRTADEDDLSKPRFGGLGMIRKHLHSFVLAAGLNVADVVIREDMRTIPGSVYPMPHGEAKALFDKVMGPQKEAARAFGRD